MTDPTPHPLPALLKEALGDAYTIEGEIGRGGMGVVYRARDERLQRRVAIKALPPELAFSSEIRERFTREAQTAAKLAHPHIVPIHDVGQGKGIVYFVMGLIEGESLAARIRRRGRVPAEETRRIMRETADALSAAHALSIIHRDIKPDNILLEGTRGRVMVTDFGIAKAMSSTSSATLTSAGMAIGTPSYMSPEQAAGEREIDGRSDLYSVGVVAYQMLSGELPFNAPTVAGILMKHITEVAPLLHEKYPDIPEDLSLAVARCLEKDPENRWASAEALRRALESRSVAGYRPTGLGMRAAERAAAPNRTASPNRAGNPTRPSPRPLARPPLGDRGTARPTRAPLGDAAGNRNNLPGRPTARDVGGLRDAGRVAREQGRAVRRGLKNNEPALPETGEPKLVRQARAEFAKFAAVVGGCFMINVATGLDGPWFLFVAGGMSIGLFKRYSELWQAGYSWRDVLNRPDAPDAIPASQAKALKGIRQVAAPKAEEYGPWLPKMQQVYGDRSAIISLWGSLTDTDRSMFPEMIQTIDGLHDRAGQLARTLNDMDRVGVQDVVTIEARLAEIKSRPESDERDRQQAMLDRQLKACLDLQNRRTEITDKLESSVLMMQGLRLELLRIKERGVGAMSDNLALATQQARAITRDIDDAISAAAEVKGL
ncbi:MAG: protein kinase [Gemmatimonadetes bacterium]|nr:protein kinase [Gemmatimonadota bacterium]